MSTILSVPQAMPVEIAGAINKIMGQIKSLPKGERNEHGHYNFASVDDFLAATGPLCSDAGLIVLQDEESMEIFDRGGKGWIKATYSFTLAHASGAMWDRPIRRTVLQQIAGPQTTGGTQSYALKMFMRSLFQIPTGERDDADYAPKEAMQTRQEERAGRAPRIQAVKLPEAPVDGSPARIAIPQGDEGLMVGRWTRMALDALAKAPDAAWRMRWLELHAAEIDDVSVIRPDYAEKVQSTAMEPDATNQADALA
jgi:hypothetical protein